MSRTLRAVAMALCFALLPAAVSAAGRPQTRAHGKPVSVDPARVRVMDGDTVEIHWRSADVETVRVLGVDTPELFERRDGRGRRMSPRGAEARGFARGAFGAADRVDLLRAAQLDRFGRTLGYLFLDRRNYSVLVIEAGLGRETISRFGDNGFPDEAAEVKDAARRTRVRRSGGP